MTAIQRFANQSAPAFELKARMMTLSILRVLNSDLDALCQQLDAKIALAPDLFRNFPVLLDFEALPGDEQCAFDIARLNWLLRDRSFIPVGIRGAGDILTGVAAGVGIGAMSLTGTSKRGREKTNEEPIAKTAANLMVRQLVRSGQQIYAQGGDAIVLGTVSPGAEILADGNIHIYGALRGRALAGVHGNTSARIFCQHLDAELVAVAGHYCLSDSIEKGRHGSAVQIFLDNENLVIENLQVQRLETTK